jgi:hypothetical protein
VQFSTGGGRGSPELRQLEILVHCLLRELYCSRQRESSPFTNLLARIRAWEKRQHKRAQSRSTLLQLAHELFPLLADRHAQKASAMSDDSNSGSEQQADDARDEADDMPAEPELDPSSDEESEIDDEADEETPAPVAHAGAVPVDVEGDVKMDARPVKAAKPLHAKLESYTVGTYSSSDTSASFMFGRRYVEVQATANGRIRLTFDNLRAYLLEVRVTSACVESVLMRSMCLLRARGSLSICSSARFSSRDRTRQARTSPLWSIQRTDKRRLRHGTLCSSLLEKTPRPAKMDSLPL